MQKKFRTDTVNKKNKIITFVYLCGWFFFLFLAESTFQQDFNIEEIIISINSMFQLLNEELFL